MTPVLELRVFAESAPVAVKLALLFRPPTLMVPSVELRIFLPPALVVMEPLTAMVEPLALSVRVLVPLSLEIFLLVREAFVSARVMVFCPLLVAVMLAALIELRPARVIIDSRICCYDGFCRRDGTARSGSDVVGACAIALRGDTALDAIACPCHGDEIPRAYTSKAYFCAHAAFDDGSASVV